MSSAHKKKSVNASMTLSDAGKAAIAREEGFRDHPYNDQAKHCTVGIGILLHKGACTPSEKKKSYDLTSLNATFVARLHEAQDYVIHYVRETKLRQQEFDALTSFVFNVGVGQARQALAFANAGKHDALREEMLKYVNVRVKDHKGKVHAMKSSGLMKRRQHETAPFKPVEK